MDEFTRNYSELCVPLAMQTYWR